MRERRISFALNGARVSDVVPVERIAREYLREDRGLTGTKAACEDGMCGACSILLDGSPVKSCLLLAVHLDGHEVTTVEGLADGDRLHPVQQALADRFAIQCGFCTPGFAVTIAGYLAATPEPGVEDVRTALAGNICRCTGYVRIVDATLEAARRMRESGAVPS